MKNLNNFFRPKFALAVFLILILAAVTFSPALQADFVNWDDPAYISQNDLIRGLSPNTIKQIFSTYILGNYQPLTILSFAFEHSLFGLKPFIYHLTNIILHLFNIVLVYVFVCYLSGRRTVALLTGLLFALHPFRVESVVWVTERKDVLFAFFYLTGLIFYLKYLSVHKKNAKYITFTFGCFILSLLAKPAAISFPLALFCLDYVKSRRMTTQSILEKLPFLILSLLLGLIAILGTFTPTNDAYPVANTISGTLDQTITPLDKIEAAEEMFTLPERVLIACRALVNYAVKSIYFNGLSPYYPLPTKANGHLGISHWIAPLIIFIVIWLLYRFKNKTARFGTLFFVTTLFFNLPITRIGSVEIAERFTYIPYIGLFYLWAILLESAFENLKSKAARWNVIFTAGITLLIFSFASNTFLYTRIWQNSERLWTHVIHQYPFDAKGYFNRGNYYFEQKDYGLAIEDYRKALRYAPENPKILYNLGNSYLYGGQPQLALASYTAALRIKPDYPAALHNKAIVLQGLK